MPLCHVSRSGGGPAGRLVEVSVYMFRGWLSGRVSARVSGRATAVSVDDGLVHSEPDTVARG